MEKSTLKYILKRLAIAVVTLFVIVFVLFMILKLMPGTPFNDENSPKRKSAIIAPTVWTSRCLNSFSFTYPICLKEILAFPTPFKET